MSHDLLDLARDAYERTAWADAYSGFCAADEQAPLDHVDLERAARAAELVGRPAESDALWQRAVNESARTGDTEHAARCAFWLGSALMQRGDIAQAGGWLARARGLFEETGTESAVAGYLLIAVALPALFSGDAASRGRDLPKRWKSANGSASAI